MAKIAILGFGTVGSGVYEVLRRNAASVSRRAGEPVEVKYILDPKDFTGNPVEPLVVKNIDVILQNPEIRGTIAGEDTVSCGIRTHNQAAVIIEKLYRIIHSA